MQILARMLLIILISIPIAIIVFLIYSLQDYPLVNEAPPLTHRQIAKAKTIIKKNDPRLLKKGQKNYMTMKSSDVSNAFNYLLTQITRGGFETRFDSGEMDIKGTAILPQNPFGQYLNIQLNIEQSQYQPDLDKLTIGEVAIPNFIIDLTWSLIKNTAKGSQLVAITEMLDKMQISPNKLLLAYTYSKQNIQQVKDLIVTRQDKDVLYAYQEKLVQITKILSDKRKYSITVILEPLFKHAMQRSVKGDPVEENRALLTILNAYIKYSFYKNGENLSKLTGRRDRPPKPLQLLIYDNDDLAEHLAFTAGMAVTGGKALANAVGINQEFGEVKGHRGFSFADYAANLAGMRLAELATTSQSSARRIQRIMSNQLSEGIFMPRVDDLPSNVDEKEFKKRFLKGESTEYKRLIKIIERRVDALPIN